MKELAYHPAARTELEAKVLFCETERPRAGAHAHADTARALVSVPQFPGLGRPGPDGIRRIVTLGYKSIVHDKLIADLIVVWAVAHPARAPGYWLARRTP